MLMVSILIGITMNEKTKADYIVCESLN